MDRVERLLELFEQVQRIPLQASPALAPFGDLTVSQVKALFYLWRCPGHLHKDLVAALGLTPASISILIKGLVNAGLVERQTDPDDARAVRLELTPAGRALVEGMRDHRRRKMAALLSALALDEQETLLCLLERAMTQADIAQTA
jgi:DNA-binding MarR family transcriptional regulator